MIICKYNLNLNKNQIYLINSIDNIKNNYKNNKIYNITLKCSNIIELFIIILFKL